MKTALFRDFIDHEDAESLLDSLSVSHLPVSKVINKTLISCTPQTPIHEAADIMSNESCSSIIVLEEGEVCGIWTEADVAKIDFTNPELFSQPVRNVMSSPVQTVPSDMHMRDVALCFRKKSIRHFLVVDDKEKPYGIVSQTDVVLTPGIEQFLRMQQVKSIIQASPIIMSEDSALSDAVINMVNQKSSAILVEYTDNSNGIITEKDIVKFVANKLEKNRIGDIASRPLKTIPENTNLYQARNILIENNLRHIGVKSEKGKVIGIISFAEILSSMELIYVQELKTALTGRMDAYKSAKSNLELAHRVIESSPDGIIFTDEDGAILSVNPGFIAVTGYKEEEVVGCNPSILSSGRHDKQFYQDMWASLKKNGSWQGEIYNRRKNGEVYPEFLTISSVFDVEGRLSNYAAIFSDISKLKNSEERIKQLAYYDSLTHLPNKQLLDDRVKMAIKAAVINKKNVLLALYDIDRFERINDSLGNRSGDEMLKLIAQRVESHILDNYTFAHIGGDKFALLVPDVDELDDSLAYIGNLLNTFTQPVTINGSDFFISASAGISIYPDDCVDSEALFQNANIALHRAKAKGGDRFDLFSVEHAADLRNYLEVENGLRRAITNLEFSLNYQPIFNLKNDDIVGFEALLRWDDPVKGQIKPCNFIPVAEDSDLIISIGDWVLRKSCKDISLLIEKLGVNFYVSVNVSAKQFHSMDFVSKIRQLVQEFDIPKNSLRIELTESILIEDDPFVLDRMLELRELGILIHLDDFGTGYSSLGYLQSFPIHTLKLDMSFVKEIATNAKSFKLVTAMINMAHALGLQTVAEGIEYDSQAALLENIGCDSVQGFYFGRPVPLKELIEIYT